MTVEESIDLGLSESGDDVEKAGLVLLRYIKTFLFKGCKKPLQSHLIDRDGDIRVEGRPWYPQAQAANPLMTA